MRGKVRTADQVVAQIATGQWGNVTIDQCIAAGMSPDAVERRARKGVFHRQYRGVYRVGHQAPSMESSYMAAVLAAGPGAVLSGSAAACLYGLTRGHAPRPEVTVAADRRVPGVIVHRVRHLDARDTRRCKRILTTTPARTVVDLATHLDLGPLGEACHQAGVRYRLTPRHVKAALRRKPNAKGAWKLKEIFEGQARITLSDLERGFLAVLRAEGLPLPVTNRRMENRYVDCRWPAHALTVELDSYTFHSSRHSWEESYRREREARARGEEVRRYNWHDVVEQPGPMTQDLRSLLAARVGSPPG